MFRGEGTTVLNLFQWISFFSILGIALAAGYGPLIHRSRNAEQSDFPVGQAFTAGVFLGLSQAIMLPNGLHLFSIAFPNVKFYIAAFLTVSAFVILLAINQSTSRHEDEGESSANVVSPLIPVIMTVMIAIPSFLLGTALGVSALASAVMVFVAIVAHKGSAGFALALSMAQSSLTRKQSLILYSVFVFSTPLGILFGADLHQYLSGYAMLVGKAVILSIAAGIFLFMATLHDLKNAPLIAHCKTMKGFTAMAVGLLITILSAFILGLAHSHHHH